MQKINSGVLIFINIKYPYSMFFYIFTIVLDFNKCFQQYEKKFNPVFSNNAYVFNFLR